MSSATPSITVVIPALDPLGEQSRELKGTIDSIEAALAEFRHEILVTAPQRVCHQARPAWLEQRCRLLAESAPGHSHALNTGADAAQHEFILVLNPGDQLLSSPRLKLALSELKPGTLHCFRVVSERGLNGGAFPPCTEMPIGRYVQRHGLKSFSYLPHQGLLVPSALLKKSKLCYNTRYRLRMDFDLLMQLAKHQSQTSLTAEVIPITYYPAGGASQTIENLPRFFIEEIKITWKHQKRAWPSSAAKWMASIIRQIYLGLLRCCE